MTIPSEPIDISNAPRVRERVNAQIQMTPTDPTNVWFFIKSGPNYYLFDVTPQTDQINPELWNYMVIGIPIGGPGDTGFYEIIVIRIDGVAKDSFLANKGLWLAPGGHTQLPTGAQPQKNPLPVLRVC